MIFCPFSSLYLVHPRVVCCCCFSSFASFVDDIYMCFHLHSPPSLKEMELYNHILNTKDKLYVVLSPSLKF